jgi:hypothetical protein
MTKSTTNKKLLILLAIAAGILLIPLAAMQFTEEVNWTPSDFMVFGTLVLGTGLMIGLVIGKIRLKKYRILLIMALVILFMLTWAELGVGLFGSPISGD